jgi:hypothetical protein
MMQNDSSGSKSKILFIWDPYFPQEEKTEFEKFTNALHDDYGSQLTVLTADKIERESFNDVIAAIVFSDSAHTTLSNKINKLCLNELPVILSIISQQIDTSDKDKYIRAFPSAKTVGLLLAKTLFKEEGNCDKITSFFLPSDTAKICAKAFEESLKWFYADTINQTTIIRENESESADSLLQKCTVDSETCVVIYGYDSTYHELLKKLIEKNPKRIISEFNTPDIIKNNQKFSYVCFENPLTSVALFIKITQVLLDALSVYVKELKDATIEERRKELRNFLLNQSHFRKTSMGTFHFTENNDFFCPFYLKRGGSDKVELIEGMESPPEIAVTALSECNKCLDKFTVSTTSGAFQELLEGIRDVLSNKLFCEDFSIISQEINKWYPDNSKDWIFMSELPSLFYEETFWEKNDSDNAFIKNIQLPLKKPDLEDYASYRIYINQRPFLQYLFSEENSSSPDVLHNITIAKCLEDIDSSPKSEEKEVKSFIDKLKQKCKKIQQIKNDYGYAYFIFLRQEQKKQNSQQQHACCYCFTKKKFGLFELTILENIATIINRTILEIAYKNEMLKKSIKVSKSAIMSRNMSHNLGSHVMTYLKQNLSSVKSIVEWQALKDLVEGKSLDELSGFTKDRINAMELPFLVGLGHFINYLQERQDYVATVATDYIPAKTTISFKDFIYDELKLDLRHERHKDDKDYTGKKPYNILLNYIAYSEGYKESNKIDILFRDFNGLNHKKKDDSETETFKQLRKLDVALPGGTVGRQAFFSIMENIIRNTAKHGNNPDDDKMTIVIDLIEDVNYLKQIVYVDETSTENLDEKKRTYLQLDCLVSNKYKKYCAKYHIISITSKNRNKLNCIEDLKKAIGSRYTGHNKDNYKGIKEMRISAAWLRGYEIDTDIENTTEPPALTVRGVDYSSKDDTCAIQYIICLPKPKKIVFILNNKTAKLNDKIAKLNDKIIEDGWQIFTDYSDTISDYDLIVISKDVSDKEKIEQNIHARILEASNISIEETVQELYEAILKGSLDEKNVTIKDEILGKYYKNWICSTFKIDTEKLPWIVICDKKAAGNKNKYDLDKVEIIGSNSDNIKEADRNQCILFSTHYKGVFEFDKVGNPKEYPIKNAGFIEGISGANSTDRLIRKNEKTKEWQYKHITAALTKVAIIDERIFSYVCPDNYESEESKKIKEELLELKRKLTSSNDKDSLITKQLPSLLAPFGSVVSQDKHIDLYKRLENYLLSDEKMACPELPIYDKMKMQEFYEKGICIYNIEIPKDSSQSQTIDIIGYSMTVGENLDSNYTIAKIRNIGKIEKNGDIELNDNLNVNKFDFVTIHQSLLDKIYGFLEIEEKEEKEKEIDKIKFTARLHKIFNKNPKEFEEDKITLDFAVPRLIIHSGRSRPSMKDMPQHQPFIQFSALENAIKDCKYTLTELLYSAHYEKNSDNNTF